MPEDTIASAAWRTCASVTPQPKLFQLFHPSGGVSAGLPGAATEAGTAVRRTASTAAITRVSSLLRGMSASSGHGGATAGAGTPAVHVPRSAGGVGLGQQSELPGQPVV